MGVIDKIEFSGHSVTAWGGMKLMKTEAAFRSILMAYNLLALFRQVVLKSKSQATLSTLRFKCFALGAWVIKHARITTLKISATGEKRRWLDALFDTVSKKAPPYIISTA